MMEHDGAGGPTTFAFRNKTPVRPNTFELRLDTLVNVIIQQSATEYRCLDCEVSLTSYENNIWTDTSVLDEHVYVNSTRGGVCRYIKKRYENNPKGLALVLGKARFRRGYVAFPDLVFYGSSGFVELDNVQRCVLCTTEKGGFHPPQCSIMAKRMDLHMLKLHEPNLPLLFFPPKPTTTNNGCGWNYNGLDKTTYGRFETLFSVNNLECDGTKCFDRVDDTQKTFNVLGEKANMTYVNGTEDTHTCAVCSTSIDRFEEGDTLLREHVYHVYNCGNTCAYLERMFTGNDDKHNREALMRIVAEERFRKGFIAYADKLLCANQGYYLGSCVMCTRTGVVHANLCVGMRNGLKHILRYRKWL